MLWKQVSVLEVINSRLELVIIPSLGFQRVLIVDGGVDMFVGSGGGKGGIMKQLRELRSWLLLNRLIKNQNTWKHQ